MLAVDTNILVYAHRREASEHVAAAQVVKALAEGTQSWAVPWPCVYERGSRRRASHTAWKLC